MNYVVNFFLNKIKILMIISFLVVVLCYIYCMPVSLDEIIEFIFKSIGSTLFFSFPIFMAKFNNFVGNTEFFTSVKYLDKMYIYGYFSVTFFGIFAGFLSLYIAFRNRDFTNSVVLMPSIFGGYTTARSVKIYEHEMIKYNKKR